LNFWFQESFVILKTQTVFTLSVSSSINMEESKIVSVSIDIDANPSKIWYVITNENYAKELGNYREIDRKRTYTN